ncbi:MAG: hypothetical protein SPI30_01460 [Prevotella sp.]|nr:hypothetical protein [Prevotella sp.]
MMFRCAMACKKQILGDGVGAVGGSKGEAVMNGLPVGRRKTGRKGLVVRA